MKIDAMTLGAVGFAAFAAWYTLKPKPQTSAQTAADIAFGQAKAQRQEVGAALYQNSAAFFDGSGAWAAPDPNSPTFFDGTGAWRI